MEDLVYDRLCRTFAGQFQQCRNRSFYGNRHRVQRHAAHNRAKRLIYTFQGAACGIALPFGIQHPLRGVQVRCLQQLPYAVLQCLDVYKRQPLR